MLQYNHLQTLIGGLTASTNLIGTNQFNPDFFQSQLDQIFDTLENEQNLYEFIESNRGQLEISNNCYLQQKFTLEQMLADHNFDNYEKLITLFNLGQPFLLTLVLLMLKTRIPAHQQHWDILTAMVPLIHSMNQQSSAHYLSNHDFNSFFLVAYNTNQHWLIEALAKLNVNLANTYEVQQAILIEHQRQNFYLINYINQLLTPKTDCRLRYIERSKININNILRNNALDNISKSIQTITIAARILLIMNYLALESPTINHKLNVPERLIITNNLVILFNRAQAALITPIDLDYLLTSAKQLDAFWLVNIISKHQLTITDTPQTQTGSQPASTTTDSASEIVPLLERVSNPGSPNEVFFALSELTIEPQTVDNQLIAPLSRKIEPVEDLPNPDASSEIAKYTNNPTPDEKQQPLTKKAHPNKKKNKKTAPHVPEAAQAMQEIITQPLASEIPPLLEPVSGSGSPSEIFFAVSPLTLKKNITSDCSADTAPTAAPVTSTILNIEPVQLLPRPASSVEIASSADYQKLNQTQPQLANKNKKKKKKKPESTPATDEEDVALEQAIAENLTQKLTGQQAKLVEGHAIPESQFREKVNNYDYAAVNHALAQNPNYNLILESMLLASGKQTSRQFNEFISAINLTIRSCFILLLSNQLSNLTRLAFIKKVLSPQYSAKEYFPFNKVCNFKEICQEFFKNNPKVTNELQKLLISKELACAQDTNLIQDQSEQELHYFMRYMPTDFEILALIIPRHLARLAQTQPGMLPQQLINQHGQNFLHILTKEHSAEVNQQVINFLQHYDLRIISAAMFKDHAQKTPYSYLEEKASYPQAVLATMSEMILTVIDYLACNEFNLPAIALSNIDDFFGNRLANNAIIQNFKAANFIIMHKIIVTHHEIRTKALHLCLNIARRQKSAINLDDPDFIQTLKNLRNILSRNEYNTVKVDDKYLLNALMEINVLPGNDYTSSFILASNEFKYALEIQPLTAAYFWLDIEDKLFKKQPLLQSQIFKNIQSYIKYSKVNPNQHDCNNLNILDKVLQFSDLNGIKTCCEAFAVKVQERHLINHVMGSNCHNKHAAELLPYLLEKFNDPNAVFKIGNEQNHDLLFYAAIGAKNPAMIKKLINYGFSSSKLYSAKKVSLISMILNEFKAKHISAEIILPILKACLDSLSATEQKKILCKTDPSGFQAIHSLFILNEEQHLIATQLIDFFIAHGSDIFNSQSPDKNPCSIFLIATSKSIVAHVLKIMQQHNAEQLKTLLQQPNKDQQTVLDKALEIFTPTHPMYEIIALIEKYSDSSKQHLRLAHQ